MFLSSIFGRMKRRDNEDGARHWPHIFTIKESPRLSRELWERFRAAAGYRDETTIDALRRALELYIEQGPKR